MKEKLQGIASELGLLFGFGQTEQFNTLCNSLSPATGKGVLFHEGYFTANWQQDGQGALETRYNLSLVVAVSSSANDTPEEKQTNEAALTLYTQTLYKRLTKIGEVSNASVTMVTDQSTRGVDLFRLTLTLLPPAISICRL